MDEEREEQLVNDMEQFSAEQLPFDLSTGDFSAFRPRTIFIALEPNALLPLIQQRFTDFLMAKNYPVKKDKRPFHPHITIATRDLRKKAFSEAWPYFTGKQFRAQWRAEGISLLAHNKKNWDVVHTSQFKNI